MSDLTRRNLLTILHVRTMALEYVSRAPGCARVDQVRAHAGVGAALSIGPDSSALCLAANEPDGSCVCSGCRKEMLNAWNDEAGNWCLCCLAQQRAAARKDADRLDYLVAHGGTIVPEDRDGSTVYYVSCDAPWGTGENADLRAALDECMECGQRNAADPAFANFLR